MVHYRNHFCFVPIERRKKTTQKHSPAGGSGETEMTRWSRHDQRAILIPAVTHCCLSTLTSASFSSHFLSRCTRARNLLFDSYSRSRISIGKKIVIERKREREVMVLIIEEKSKTEKIEINVITRCLATF